MGEADNEIARNRTSGNDVRCVPPVGRVWNAIAVLVLLSLIVWVIRTGQYVRDHEIDLPILQYVVLPFVFLLAWRCGWIGRLVPREIVLFSLAGFLVLGFISFALPSDNAFGFVVARLRDDSLESDTRIFRQQIGHKMDLGLSARVLRYHRALQNEAEARKLLEKDPSLNGIVWGDRRYLTISLPRTPALSLEELGLSNLPERLRGLRLITSVPIVGISFEPSNDTSFFLAHLFDGLLPNRTPIERQVAGSDSKDELSLRTAAVYRAHWTGLNHQALPWWELGNRYLYEALAGGEFRMGEMQCALYAYRRARQALPGKGNAELSAAISNNAAIAVAIKQYFSASKVDLKFSRKAFKAAVRMRRDKTPQLQRYESWRVAYYNLHWINLFAEKDLSRHSGANRVQRKKRNNRGSQK